MRRADPTGYDLLSPEGVRALARMAAVSELAFGLSHALNNALTAIVGEASFLHGETPFTLCLTSS